MSKSIEPAKTLGGYMGLQLFDGNPYYPNLIALNTARNSLEYILKIRGYNTIYLPFFTCEVLLEPIKKLGLACNFYKIDDQFNPLVNYVPAEKTCFLYTNYFGVKTNKVKQLAQSTQNLIIDNAQAFYAEPISGIDTFYSCRKFFGVPDGAYLYTSSKKRLQIDVDSSTDRFSHLIKAVDQNTEAGYEEFVRNDASLNDNEILEMSPITEKLLAGIDYEQCAEIRKRNFAYLHAQLSEFNEMKFDYTLEDVPMVYPFLINRTDLKEQLIRQRIFVATYWPNVFDWTPPGSTEYYLSEHIIPLPIDHRYQLEDMQYIINIIKSLLSPK
ncbi:MAG: hypothetical protein JWQ28_2758 [Pedobacter sp.]|nr:hypothetical protein [Pedobacter sp.]